MKFNPQKYITENSLQNEYSYILGLYLGDGYINKMKRTYRLRIFNDIKYDSLNKYIIKNLEKLFLKNKVSTAIRQNTVSIGVYNNYLPILFPQHGKGKKSDREIKLYKWQKDIISERYLLMGLLHSDGCYYKNTIGNKKYSSYGFSNLSNDIHKIFQNSCKKLNISYTKSGVNTHIRNRKSVEYIEKNIGDKENLM